MGLGLFGRSSLMLRMGLRGGDRLLCYRLDLYFVCLSAVLGLLYVQYTNNAIITNHEPLIQGLIKPFSSPERSSI